MTNCDTIYLVGLEGHYVIGTPFAKSDVVFQMVPRKRMMPKCKLLTRDAKIKQVQKCQYLGNILTEDGKCDAEIQRCV